MKFKKDFDVHVIVGGWNHAIFNAEWVSKYLLDGEKKLNVVFPINTAGSPQIQGKNVKIYTLGNKLSFQSIPNNDTNFEIVQNIALKTANYLPHTPVIACGYNFVFEQKATKELEDLFIKLDKPKIKSELLELTGMAHKRAYSAKDYTLNLTVNQTGNIFQFDFNYHFPLKDLVQYKELVDTKKITNYKTHALKLMLNTYNLELDE